MRVLQRLKTTLKTTNAPPEDCSSLGGQLILAPRPPASVFPDPHILDVFWFVTFTLEKSLKTDALSQVEGDVPVSAVWEPGLGSGPEKGD